MNDSNLHERQDRVNELAYKHLLLCESELRDRVAELEAERNTYRELAVVALENVAQLTYRNRQLADRIDDLNRALRGLFTEPRANGRAA
jgi:hypothetical protein